MVLFLKRNLLLVLLMGILGCATTYVPRPYSINPNIIPENGTNQSLTLLNAQISSEIIDIGSAGMGRSLEGNLRQWTDKAIDLTKDLLIKRGFTVSRESQKILKLAITQANFESAAGGWGFICTVNLTVDTGNKQHFEFVGQKVDWKYVRSCDKAFTDAVSGMLADNTIQSYTTE